MRTSTIELLKKGEMIEKWAKDNGLEIIGPKKTNNFDIRTAEIGDPVALEYTIRVVDPNFLPKKEVKK